MTEEIRQLREKYRGFMRGKQTHPDYFFENERLLAYAITTNEALSANANTNALTLDILNKETEERKAFEVDIPSKNRHSFVEVSGIRIVDDNLYVVTKNDQELDDTGFTTNQAVQLYAIDMNKEQLISVE